MGNIISLRHRPFRLAAILAGGAPHQVEVRVIDRTDPDTTHWQLLRWNFRAARFAANKGFKQRQARRSTWHSFEIQQTSLAYRYVRETYSLRSAGLIELWIDGNRIHGTVGKSRLVA